MPRLEVFVGTVIGVLTLVLMLVGLYFQAAQHFGWKPRAGRLKAMLSHLQAHWLAILALASIALLVSSWVMYEWPQKPIIKTETKTVRVEVPILDQRQAATIQDLQVRLRAAEDALAGQEQHGQHKPTSSPTQQTGQMLPTVTIPGSGNAVTFGQQGGLAVGTLMTGQRPPRTMDDNFGKKLLAAFSRKK